MQKYNEIKMAMRVEKRVVKKKNLSTNFVFLTTLTFYFLAKNYIEKILIFYRQNMFSNGVFAHLKHCLFGNINSSFIQNYNSLAVG